jgi:hypothetical protein
MNRLKQLEMQKACIGADPIDSTSPPADRKEGQNEVKKMPFKGLHQLSLQNFFNRCKSETPHAWECEEASSMCWHVHIDLAVPDILLLPFLHSARKTFLHSC